MVIHLLDERRMLHLDDAVVEYFPEFGKHGKDGVTIRQILTHRAGIPAVRDVPVDVELLTDPQRLLADPLRGQARERSRTAARVPRADGRLRARRGRAPRDGSRPAARAARGDPRAARLRHVRLRRPGGSRRRGGSERLHGAAGVSAAVVGARARARPRRAGGDRDVERCPVPDGHRPVGQHHRHRERGEPFLPAPARGRRARRRPRLRPPRRPARGARAVVPRVRLVPGDARPLCDGLHAGSRPLHAVRASHGARVRPPGVHQRHRVGRSRARASASG